MKLSESEKVVIVQALLLVPASKLTRFTKLDESSTGKYVMSLVNKINDAY